MALVDRPTQHSAGTDGRMSSAVPVGLPSQSRPSPGRERRTTSSRSGGQSGDGSEFPRYLMQLSHEVKRTRAYDLIQELQLMICSKETGMKGNSTRARAMVLLKEVQSVLMGLENKVDAQTFDLGVAAVERSELRKELRDEKAKEVAPFHTVDFRSTDVRDLPHKLRTLFEDNQLLREQVRQLQYAVRSTEAKLEAARRRNGELELEAAGLSVALREAGGSLDTTQEMRRLRESARTAEARALHLEGQVVSLLQQMEADRQAAAAAARQATARQAALEEKLRAALGVAAAGRVGGGRSRKSSARSAVVEGWDLAAAAAVDDDDEVGEGVSGGGRPGGCRTLEVGIPDCLLDADGAALGSGGGDGGGGGGGSYGGGGLSGGYVAGGGEARSSVKAYRQSAYSTASSVAGGGGGSRSRLSSGRDHSPASPPRSPVGRSLSHSPGSSIPALYPLFNAKPRPTHAFSPESPAWNSSAHSVGGGGSSSYADGGGGGGGTPPSVALHLPPRPHSHVPREVAAAGAVSPRGSGTGGGGGGGGASRPHSGSHTHSGPGPGSGSLEVLQEARVGGPSPTSTRSTASRDGALPGEQVRAINSSAVVTSRTLLPSVSSGSASGSASASGSTAGGVGAVGAAGGAAGSARTSGLGILSLRVSMGTGSGSGGTGGGGGIRRSSGCGAGGSGLQVISPEPAAASAGGGGGSWSSPRAERRGSARQRSSSSASLGTGGGGGGTYADGGGGGGGDAGASGSVAEGDSPQLTLPDQEPSAPG